MSNKREKKSDSKSGGPHVLLVVVVAALVVLAIWSSREGKEKKTQTEGSEGPKEKAAVAAPNDAIRDLGKRQMGSRIRTVKREFSGG